MQIRFLHLSFIDYSGNFHSSGKSFKNLKLKSNLKTRLVDQIISYLLAPALLT